VRRIRILIYAKQTSTRQKVRSLLEIEADFEVIGEAGDGPETLELINTRSPDILIFSLTCLGDLDILRAEHLHLKVNNIVVYSDADADYSNEMLRCGAKAYLSSECAPTELVTAVRKVMSGNLYLSSPLFERAIQNYIKKDESPSNSPSELLTRREFEVFNLVAKGSTSAQIAAFLSISRRTVEIHRANMLRKLNLASQYKQIRNYAKGLGVISSDTEDIA